MNILILDIETSPNLAYVWRFWKENVGAKQVLQHNEIMSFAAKWLSEDLIIYYDKRDDKTDYKLCKLLSEVLNLADIVIAHNGKKFDLAHIRGRCLANGIKPFSPVKIIDTLLVAKKEFAFPSNSLEYLGEVLGCSIKKKNHAKFPGFLLWKECLSGNREAWEEMKEYNIEDVRSLEQVYLAMRPWITDHPNINIKIEGVDRMYCTKCGSSDVQKRGYAYTAFHTYHRFRCNSCGGWSRSRFTLTPNRKNLLANQVN